MYKRDEYAERFIDVIRWVGLGLPLLVIFYTFMAAANLVPRAEEFNLISAGVITLLLAACAIWQFLTRNYSSSLVALRLGLFHILGGFYFLLVSSFSSPLTFSWLVLIVISEIFYAVKGTVLSIATLLVFAGVALLQNLHQPDTLVQVILVLIYTIFCALFAILLRSVTRDQYSELQSARENRASERSQLISILNSMSMGIVSVDENGDIRLYNAAFLGLLDTNDNVTGKPVNTVMKLTTTDKKPIKLMDLVQKTYMTRREDIVLNYSDDDHIRLSILINPIRGRRGQLSGYIFVIEDITKEKSLEEERDEFISVVSHELRTPVAIAEGSISNAQLLLEHKASTKLLDRAFEEAHEQIMFLSNMVNDLGTLSRAERNVGDELEEIDINDLAGSLHAKYDPRAHKRKLQFNLDIVGHIGTVHTSRLYLEEILQNFITNSIKYTEKGTVTLKIRRVGDGVQFSVIDTGIGISKADQRRIFEKFYRSEDYRTRETTGNGLGLYVVAKLAKKMGITIEISSRLNHGSTFSFVLPKSQPDHK